jgi:hypothetical protein
MRRLVGTTPPPNEEEPTHRAPQHDLLAVVHWTLVNPDESTYVGNRLASTVPDTSTGSFNQEIRQASTVTQSKLAAEPGTTVRTYLAKQSARR